MMDQGKQEGMRPLGRARGLLVVWEQIRREERARLRMGGIWTPKIRVPGQGRVATLALLHEMATQNAARTPGPEHQTRRGRERGLHYLLGHDHDENYPTSGMGRARVRNPGSHSEPPVCLPYMCLQCLCRDLLENIPCSSSLENSDSSSDSSDSGPPSLESITHPEPPEFDYDASNLASSSD